MKAAEFREFYKGEGGGGFREEIRTYFADHLYEGFTKNFELSTNQSFFISSSSPDQDPVLVQIRPKNLNDEDILNQDYKWESGLKDVGERHGVRLSLHPIVYAK